MASAEGNVEEHMDIYNQYANNSIEKAIIKLLTNAVYSKNTIKFAIQQEGMQNELEIIKDLSRTICIMRLIQDKALENVNKLSQESKLVRMQHQLLNSISTNIVNIVSLDSELQKIKSDTYERRMLIVKINALLNDIIETSIIHANKLDSGYDTYMYTILAGTPGSITRTQLNNISEQIIKSIARKNESRQEFYSDTESNHSSIDVIQTIESDNEDEENNLFRYNYTVLDLRQKTDEVNILKKENDKLKKELFNMKFQDLNEEQLLGMLKELDNIIIRIEDLKRRKGWSRKWGSKNVNHLKDMINKLEHLQNKLHVAIGSLSKPTITLYSIVNIVYDDVCTVEQLRIQTSMLKEIMIKAKKIITERDLSSIHKQYLDELVSYYNTIEEPLLKFIGVC